MLSIERRRAANGGRHLPSTYTLHEAPQTSDTCRTTAPEARQDRYRQRRRSVPTGRRTGTGRAEDRYRQGRRRVPAGRRTGTGRAEDGYWQGGGAVLAGRNFRHRRYCFAALYRAHERACCRKGSRKHPSPFSYDYGKGGGGGSRLGGCRVVRSADLGMGARDRRDPAPRASSPIGSGGWTQPASCLSATHASGCSMRWTPCSAMRSSAPGR